MCGRVCVLGSLTPHTAPARRLLAPPSPTARVVRVSFPTRSQVIAPNAEFLTVDEDLVPVEEEAWVALAECLDVSSGGA